MVHHWHCGHHRHYGDDHVHRHFYLKRNLIGDKSREGWWRQSVKCSVGRDKQCHWTGLEIFQFFFHFETIGLEFLLFFTFTLFVIGQGWNFSYFTFTFTLRLGWNFYNFTFTFTLIVIGPGWNVSNFTFTLKPGWNFYFYLIWLCWWLGQAGICWTLLSLS